MADKDTYLMYGNGETKVITMKELKEKFNMPECKILFFIRNDMYLRDYKITTIDETLQQAITDYGKSVDRKFTYRQKLKLLSVQTKDLYRKHYPLEEIAEIMKVPVSTVSAILTPYRKIDPEIMKHSKKAEMEEKRIQLKELYDEGYLACEAAIKLGIPKSTASRFIMEMKEKGEITVDNGRRKDRKRKPEEE